MLLLFKGLRRPLYGLPLRQLRGPIARRGRRQVDRRRHEAIGAVARLHDHIIGLGHGDLELVGFDRSDILAIGLTIASGSPGVRMLKIDMAEALMMRSRTRSPGKNRPVQFSAKPWPLIR
jgi:hypothetical protein